MTFLMSSFGRHAYIICYIYENCALNILINSVNKTYHSTRQLFVFCSYSVKNAANYLYSADYYNILGYSVQM